jgi:hypothetical protein
MKNLIMLLVLAASMIACETHGLIESSYEGKGGNHLSLQQYQHEGRFFYSLSAGRHAHACDIAELKVVAMGAGGKVRVRVERSPGGSCEST